LFHRSLIRPYEIHFPRDHVSCHLDGSGTFSYDTPVTFPVSKVCHITHNLEAQQIQASNGFQPREKFGRPNSSHPRGASYRCTLYPPNGNCYQRIFDTEHVFPGHYSWWGLWVTDPRPTITLHPIYSPGYLKKPPESFYGSQAFVISFPNLLRAYATSRGCDPGDICLRMGGTRDTGVR